MKKLFAMLTALCLMLGCAALAETALDWADFEASIAESDLDGAFQTFDEVPMKIWIPSDLHAVELEDEDRDEGFIGYFEGDGAVVSIVYVDMNMTIEEYTDELGKIDDVAFIQTLTINGIPAVSYRMPESDIVSYSLPVDGGGILEVTMMPFSEDGAEETWALVASSIQFE